MADYYGDLVDLFVYDRQDEGYFGRENVTGICTDTIMHDRDGRVRLARDVLQAADQFIKSSV